MRIVSCWTDVTLHRKRNNREDALIYCSSAMIFAFFQDKKWEHLHANCHIFRCLRSTKQIHHFYFLSIVFSSDYCVGRIRRAHWWNCDAKVHWKCQTQKKRLCTVPNVYKFSRSVVFFRLRTIHAHHCSSPSYLYM